MNSIDFIKQVWYQGNCHARLTMELKPQLIVDWAIMTETVTAMDSDFSSLLPMQDPDHKIA